MEYSLKPVILIKINNYSFLIIILLQMVFSVYLKHLFCCRSKKWTYYPGLQHLKHWFTEAQRFMPTGLQTPVQSQRLEYSSVATAQTVLICRTVWIASSNFLLKCRFRYLELKSRLILYIIMAFIIIIIIRFLDLKLFIIIIINFDCYLHYC